MQLNRRLMVSLLGGVAAVSLGFAVFQAKAEMQALQGEVRRQASVLAEGQRRPVELALESGSTLDLEVLVDRFENQDHLAGMAVYDEHGRALAITPGLRSRLQATPAAVVSALDAGEARAQLFRLGDQPMDVFAVPLHAAGRASGALAIFHRVAFIAVPVLRHAITSVAQTVLIVCLTLLIVRWNLGKPVQHLTEWLRDLRTGRAGPGATLPKEGMFQPLANEVAQMATSLNAARRAAEEEARLRDRALARWTPERLRVSMQDKMHGSRLFAVSNREPYEHVHRGNAVTWSVPPSGLVTALEPVLRACDGTWIAQGTGDADRETADEHGRLRVPPDHPQYSLRRVWLGKEEEEGFYFGFANEGLWPLCHIAHTRPAFRAADWEQYRVVNQKFADVLLDEIESEKEPLVLVQDYHFALLPRLIKERRPDARIAIFWHIPWPNPEAFGICPWQSELLDGMLGADLVGFHIQAHCNNFLETVDQALESRIDWEHFAVKRHEHLTSVKPFPISVASCEDGAASSGERGGLFRQLGEEPAYVGLGVDRVDYTKGIPERFRAIERLLERHPSYREKLVFVQIGAPSRTRIKRYQDLMIEVEEEADRINRPFRTGAWNPIIFLNKHHSHEELRGYYREANFCMVTSLHDGMNLVAKEYIAARQDEQGVLILSRFAGASHELADALVVNPYNTDELAEAIHHALSMPAEEQRARMQRMRTLVQEHNVYRWAGSLIAELAAIRLYPPTPTADTELRPLAHAGGGS
ncbi:MAG TPA: trehalose-6-phosphate synthase [Bryobacteraceae bacterium]|jgi:trehalose 6-phosphate synthase